MVYGLKEIPITAKKHAAKDVPPASAATLRDSFAQAALVAYCHSTLAGASECLDLAQRAYAVADAMLIAREPPEEEKPAPENLNE